MTAALDLNSAHDLARWVAESLVTDDGDTDHIVRVILRETDRWIKSGIGEQQIRELTQRPARSGSPRFDALIEGIVAYRLHVHHMQAPDWCTQTVLDEAWDPLSGGDHTSVAWRLLDTLETPVEILHKGITLSYRALRLV